MSRNDSYLLAKGFTFLVVFFLFAVQSGFAAGTGRMKGRVFDRQTKEALPGATVLVKGTSIGASTDLNGNFVIDNAPEGVQTIVVTYVGYVDSKEAVNIVQGQTISKDFYLEPTAVQGKAVIVTAQAQGQIQAINQQLSSNKIVNVVSSAKIQELPDFNAAQAISRLPGVSVLMSSGEANKVVIRGLAPQYNEVAVSGITLASTGSSQIGATSLAGLTSGSVTDDRSVDLTMVTPYMIKSIEVYKTLTPDMEANAIGGYVNMSLREAPSGFHGDVLWQSGYTQKSNTYGNYRAVASVSNRFFDDHLGVYILGDAERYDRSADNMNAGYVTAGSTVNPNGYRTVIVNNVTLNRHIETRNRYGGNLILDYRLPSGSIRSINMFSRLNSNYQDYNTILNYRSDVTNKSLGFQYRAGSSNTDLAVNSVEVTNDFGFMTADIIAANTYSRNHLLTSPFYSFFQNGAMKGFTTGDTNIVPEQLTHLVNYNAPGDTTLLGSTSLFLSDYHENDQVYKGDFRIPLNVGSVVSGYFKFGGEYRYNFHANAQSTPYISINRGSGTTANDINRAVVDSLLRYYPNLQFGITNQLLASNFTSSDSKLLNSFLGNKFGSIYWAANPSSLNWMMNYISQNPALRAYNSIGGWFDGPYQNLPNNYHYIERYYAAYLMSELDLGPDFMVVGGARYEEDKGMYSAFNLMDERNPVSQKFFPATVYPENHFWLPMVQARYDVTEWADVRYSYTQTLARPDYSQLSPHFNVSADSPHQLWAGNPGLKPAQAYNHDLELTFHSNDLGLLSIGGFYKEIKNFAYAAEYQLYSKSVYDKFGITGLDSLNSFMLGGSPALTSADAGATLNTFINSRYIAYIRGIETDFETRFWYLPNPFNGIVFGINYTHIWSKTRYPYFNVTGARGVVTNYTDSTRAGRLLYQPNDILNTYFGYDFEGFSARLSFVFQGNSVTAVGNYPEQDGFSQDYFRMDFSARQLLPWKGLELYFDSTNLNGEPNISIENAIRGFTSEQYYGLTADLGIRYTL